MSDANPNSPHEDLYKLQTQLQEIYEAISNFQPLTQKPPILDLSLDAASTDSGEDSSHWLQQEHIPGLKKLRESIKVDLDGLRKFLDDPSSKNLPPLSTNAPYLIAVWNEILCATPPIVAVFKAFLFDPTKTITSAQRKGCVLRPPEVKVDIVADNGRRWIRVNTLKNARLLAEFREIDSYMTDSGEDSDAEDAYPSLAPTEFDNSILRMGRSLLSAALTNPIQGTSEIPEVTLRLTRLCPSVPGENQTDPRIAQSIECLKDMGVEVELGERSNEELPVVSQAPSPDPLFPLMPTVQINLDLSILIALISDLTHAPLPSSVDDATKRFIPPKEYLEWKETRRKEVGNNHKRKVKCRSTKDKSIGTEQETNVEDLPHDLATHSRALTNQLLQEMGKSMIQEIHDRLANLSPSSQKDVVPDIEFWATAEARDRCLRIVSKIGGHNEKRRAYALFCLDPDSPSKSIPIEKAEELFWQNSRFDQYVHLLPIHFHSSSITPSPSALAHRAARPSFFKSLAKTCQDILAQETIPHPHSLREDFISQPTAFPSNLDSSIDHIGFGGEIQRATVTKANPRLTAHTVESMLWGAELGWTTLTANRTSVKAILKEMKVARISGRLDSPSFNDPSRTAGDRGMEVVGVNDNLDSDMAAIWIMDPRSLAEQMSSVSSVR